MQSPAWTKTASAKAVDGEIDARSLRRESARNRRADGTAADVNTGVLALEQHALASLQPA
jgi:hypothetical protein